MVSYAWEFERGNSPVSLGGLGGDLAANAVLDSGKLTLGRLAESGEWTRARCVAQVRDAETGALRWYSSPYFDRVAVDAALPGQVVSGRIQIGELFHPFAKVLKIRYDLEYPYPG